MKAPMSFECPACHLLFSEGDELELHLIRSRDEPHDTQRQLDAVCLQRRAVDALESIADCLGVLEDLGRCVSTADRPWLYVRVIENDE
jgi:hypothetical protein